jgi:hypothetical protein
MLPLIGRFVSHWKYISLIFDKYVLNKTDEIDGFTKLLKLSCKTRLRECWVEGQNYFEIPSIATDKNMP